MFLGRTGSAALLLCKPSPMLKCWSVVWLAVSEVACLTHVRVMVSPTTPRGCAASCRFWTAHEVAAISSHSGISLSGLACTAAVGVWTIDHEGPWSPQQLLDSAFVHAVGRLQSAPANKLWIWVASSAQQAEQCTCLPLQDSCQLPLWPHLALHVQSNEGGLLEELHLAFQLPFLHGKTFCGQHPLHDLQTSIHMMRGWIGISSLKPKYSKPDLLQADVAKHQRTCCSASQVLTPTHFHLLPLRSGSTRLADDQ